jgi:4a-hydroxytetrahydrobiopterin dehydratase
MINTPKVSSEISSVIQPLSATQIIAKLAHLNAWKLFGDGAEFAIEKSFSFSDFWETMAFVNAVAFIAHRKNHHPDILVMQNDCSVRFRTHDVKGVSILDFECAAQVDALTEQN